MTMGSKLSPTKAKINAINFKNLDAWEGDEANTEINLMDPSFLD